MNTTTITSTSAPDGHGYEEYRQKLRDRVAATPGPFFRTDAANLFELFLNCLPTAHQHYLCHTCRNFFERFGGLVTIGQDGRPSPVLWHEEDAPEYFWGAAVALWREVSKSVITGVFLSPKKTWGQPVTGAWSHFAVEPPDSEVYRRTTLTAGQAMAGKLADYRNVQRALAEFTPRVVDQAVTILNSEALYRTEMVIGPARWLRDLHAARDGLRGPARDNVTWLAVATAPAGFCHPRSSMAGTLLEDLSKGMSFATVSSRFAAKMHPLQYQRLKVAPAAGNIAAAEKLVEQLGIARSLERRFARLDEVEAVWAPAGLKTPASGGVFGHLLPSGRTYFPASISLPPQTITWEKCRRTVLPTAEVIEFLVPVGPANYSALVTAVHPDSPPILQWDSPDRRNPVSWYLWDGGSPASVWGLRSGEFVRVTVVSLQPNQWGPDEDAFSHQGQGVLFVLEGARETRMNGNGLFPEILKAELHAVRSTIEAYARSAKIEGIEEASACGVLLQKGSSWSARVKVRSGGVWAEYKLDRWD